MSYSIVSDNVLFDSLFGEIQTRFLDRAGSYKNWYQEVANEFNSSAPFVDYPIMPGTAKMTEMVGERSISKLGLYKQTIKNVEFQHAFEIERRALQFAFKSGDKLPALELAIAQQAQAFAKFKDSGIGMALLNGTSAKCYDGQFYFDTAHPIDPSNPSLGTVSNLHTGRAFSDTTFAQALGERSSRLGPDGLPMGSLSNTILCAPSKQYDIKKIVEAPLAANGATNVFYGAAKVIAIPQLEAEPNAWYLGDCADIVKPFIFQLGAGPEFARQDRLEDYHVNRTKNCLYTVNVYVGFGYGPWDLLDKYTP